MNGESKNMLKSFLFINIALIMFINCSNDENSEFDTLVTHLNKKKYRVVTNGLNINDKLYIDRDYVFTKIPFKLENVIYIQTANKDKNSNDLNFITFHVDRDISLFIAHSKDIKTKPDWLTNGFDKLNFNILSNDDDYDLYSTKVSSGKVILGGNIQDENDADKSMYSIIIIPEIPKEKERHSDHIIEDYINRYGIRSIPTKNELNQIKVPEEFVCEQLLTDEDINENFTNLHDLKWLKNVIINNKVFLLGEDHWNNSIHHLRNRILFALNTYDRYSLLLLEKSYSYAEYLNYYVGIADDTIANHFFENELQTIVTTQEFLLLLDHIRRWNKNNPDKRIQVGTYDWEWKPDKTLKNVIEPYIRSIDPTFSINIKRLRKRDKEYYTNLILKIESGLRTASEKNVIGKYPFIDYQYIQNIFENIKQSVEGQINNKKEKAVRSSIMIRNLKDKNVFGRYFYEGKVMIHAGTSHTITNLPYKSEDYFREGAFLSYDFDATKGRTFSLGVFVSSRIIGSMADVNTELCLYRGGYYLDIIQEFQFIYKQKLVDKNKSYIFDSDDKREYIKNYIFKLGYQGDFSPMLIKNIPWNKPPWNLDEKLKKKLIDDDVYGHDMYVFIPTSNIIKSKIEIKKQ